MVFSYLRDQITLNMDRQKTGASKREGLTSEIHLKMYMVNPHKESIFISSISQNADLLTRYLYMCRMVTMFVPNVNGLTHSQLQWPKANLSSGKKSMKFLTWVVITWSLPINVWSEHMITTFYQRLPNFCIIWKIFEEELLKPTSITALTELFLKILLCYRNIYVCVRPWVRWKG